MLEVAMTKIEIASINPEFISEKFKTDPWKNGKKVSNIKIESTKK